NARHRAASRLGDGFAALLAVRPPRSRAQAAARALDRILHGGVDLVLHGAVACPTGRHMRPPLTVACICLLSGRSLPEASPRPTAAGIPFACTFPLTHQAASVLAAAGPPRRLAARAAAFVLAAAWLLAVPTAAAAGGRPSAPLLRLESHGPDQGLPQSCVKALANDDQGFLWV